MGFFSKTVQYLKDHLSKTRTKIASSLAAVLPLGRKIDDALLDELEATLIGDDIGVETTERLIGDLRTAYKTGKIAKSDDIIPFLKAQIKSYWPKEDRQLKTAASGPTVILVAGINGSGKTTSIAKLANWLVKQKKKVLLGACDTFRAAAIDQLTVWSQRAGVDVIKHQHGSDPAAVAFDAVDAAIARKVDVLLVDTAGRLHTQDHLMRELGKIQRVVQKRLPDAPHEVLLVLDATTGQNALIQAKAFSEAVDVTAIALTKLDGTSKGGIVFAISDLARSAAHLVCWSFAPFSLETEPMPMKKRGSGYFLDAPPIQSGTFFACALEDKMNDKANMQKAKNFSLEL